METLAGFFQTPIPFHRRSTPPSHPPLFSLLLPMPTTRLCCLRTDAPPPPPAAVVISGDDSYGMKQVISLTPQIYEYLLSNTREPPILRKLREETSKKRGSQMQVSPEQAQLLAMLVRIIGAERCIEVGVYTGYSSLAIALALPESGCLVACEKDAICLETAKKYYELAGVSQKVSEAASQRLALRATEPSTTLPFPPSISCFTERINGNSLNHHCYRTSAPILLCQPSDYDYNQMDRHSSAPSPTFSLASLLISCRRMGSRRVSSHTCILRRVPHVNTEAITATAKESRGHHLSNRVRI